MRKLGYERLDNSSKDYEVGWGVNTSAGLKTWGSDVLKLQVVYGEGIGNYMNDGALDIAPVCLRGETCPPLLGGAIT